MTETWWSKLQEKFQQEQIEKLREQIKKEKLEQEQITEQEELENETLFKIQDLNYKLILIVKWHFLVKNCSNCNEIDMLLVSISPNSKSIGYMCEYCNKKMRAFADGSPQSSYAQELYHSLIEVHDALLAFPQYKHIKINLSFTIPKNQSYLN